jgi:hypothetical protein
MKLTKQSSAFSSAVARVLEAGGARFSWGLRTLLLSKNTCHLLEFYLASAQRYWQEVLGRQAQDFHDEADLLVLVLAAEERVAEVQFCDDASEAPDVDFAIVGQAEDHFGGAVVPALDVGVDGFVLEAAGAEVDDLDARLVHLLQEDVLGLEVGVDDALPVQEVDAVEQLQDESADEVEGEAVVAVAFDELVEVHGH